MASFWKQIMHCERCKKPAIYLILLAFYALLCIIFSGEIRSSRINRGSLILCILLEAVAKKLVQAQATQSKKQNSSSTTPPNSHGLAKSLTDPPSMQISQRIGLQIIQVVDSLQKRLCRSKGGEEEYPLVDSRPSDGS